jgi:DNA polymerase (family 10)
MSNKEVAQYFKLLAQLSQLHGEVEYKAQSYQTAARQIERQDTPVIEYSKTELQQIGGIGKAISNKIVELRQQGTIQALESFLEKTPAGILQMLELKGLGPKKIQRIWHEKEIDNLRDLKRACEEHDLSEMKGFGKKTEQKIAAAIDYYLENKAKLLWVEGHELARQWHKFLEQHFESVAITGAVRRKMEVVSAIELLVTTSEPGKLKTLLTTEGNLPEADIETEAEADMTVYQFYFENGMPLRIYACPPPQFGYYWYYTTGSEAHLKKMQELGEVDQQVESETAVYEQLQLHFIPPELREGTQEVEQAAETDFSELVTLDQLQGILHAHSTYSDGAESLETMARYCQEQGFQYLGISDHSQSAYYAGGLSEEELFEQMEEVDRLNEKLEDFVLFKGIESDILPDGSLDYPQKTLEQLDFVIASIHSGFQMTREQATERLIKSIEHPCTHILGHPTGRLLLRREGYPIDHKKVIDACGANQVAIEINANPNRLDLDWRWIDYALEQGVLISINPDAHSLEGIHDIQYGVYIARKGGLPASRTLNSFGSEQLRQYFENKTVPKFVKNDD